MPSNTNQIPRNDRRTVKGKKAKAMADQIATVSKLRLINKHGTIAKSDMPGVDQAIKTQLHLN